MSERCGRIGSIPPSADSGRLTHYCRCTKPSGHRGPHWCGQCCAQWHGKWAVSGRTINTRNRLEQEQRP